MAEDISTGQKQKLAIALALTQDADLFIFDEPLASIDADSTEVILEQIVKKTEGKTLITILHGASHPHNLFDRVIKLNTQTSL